MMKLAEGVRVEGAAGVFYTDRPMTGTVLNNVQPDCVHVLLDDGDKAVVPIAHLSLVG